MTEPKPYVVQRNGIVLGRSTKQYLGRIDRGSGTGGPNWVAVGRFGRVLAWCGLRSIAADVVWQHREDQP